jgi:hypothetical protein
LFLKRKLERELDEEIRAHLEMQIEENVGRGMTPDEARYQALVKFGGVEQVKESYRERRIRGLSHQPDADREMKTSG